MPRTIRAANHARTTTTGGHPSRGREGLDANVAGLVVTLNRFPGVATVASCGGHPDPGSGQWPERTWYVKFDLPRSEAGWLSLEFLAWAINTAYRADRPSVVLLPDSPPPYLNKPGECLKFMVEGRRGARADDLAAWLARVHGEFFGESGPNPTGPPAKGRHAKEYSRRPRRS